jgi:hypothetical protein
MNGFVTRLRSLAEAERFIANGIPSSRRSTESCPLPVQEDQRAPLVIRGFTATGDVITNDPRYSPTPTRSGVRTRRFEKVWLEGSAGIVYVIYPMTSRCQPTRAKPELVTAMRGLALSALLVAAAQPARRRRSQFGVATGRG